MTAARTVRNQDGALFDIPAEPIPGIVHIEKHLDSARGVDAARGILQFIFAFATVDESRFTHITPLSPFTLLPRLQKVRRAANDRFKAEVSLTGIVLDTRDMAAMELTDGGELRSAHKYNDITFRLRTEESYLAVRLRLYTGDSTPIRDSYTEIDYEIPYEYLLWRNAPVLSHDDMVPESADYVNIKRLGSLKDPGVSPGERASLIVYTPAHA